VGRWDDGTTGPPDEGTTEARWHPSGMRIVLGRKTGGVARASLYHRLIAGKPPAWGDHPGGIAALGGDSCPGGAGGELLAFHQER
jgi:hypothetical protein